MNIKKTRVINVLFFLLITTSAYSQRYSGGLVDKVIALVGNEMIQLSTIEEEVQMQMMQGIITDKNLRCEILENMLVSKLMLTQARIDSLTVNEEYVELELEGRLQDIKTRLGGEKATEEYFHKPVFKLKQEWRELFREQSLTRDMQSTITQAVPALTPKDVEIFYNKTPKDNMLLCVITDNGIGYMASYNGIRRVSGYKKESLGLKLTEDRLRVINQMKLSQASFTIQDLQTKDNKLRGTRVLLSLPYISAA